MTTNGFTTEIAASTELAEESYVSSWQWDWDVYLLKYAAGVIILIGILGNLLTIGVMMSKAFRRTPSSLVLSALALADTGSLCTGLMRSWVRYIQDSWYSLRDVSNAACKTHLFFTYFFGHLSAAFLVIMTIDRFVSVYYPLRCREICSKRRLGICLMLTSIVCGLTNVYLAVVYSLQFDGYAYYCWMDPHHANNHYVYFWIEACVGGFLPFIIIFTANILISKKLMKAQQSRETMTSNSKKERQSLTPMLMAVSWCFIILNAPSWVFQICVSYDLWDDSLQNIMNQDFAWTIVNLLYYTNNAINFFLYCLTGTKFRSVLRDLLASVCSTNTKGKQPMTSFTDLNAESHIDDTRFNAPMTIDA